MGGENILIGLGGQSNARRAYRHAWSPAKNLKIWAGDGFKPADQNEQSLGALIGDRVARDRPDAEVHVAVAARGGLAISHWLDTDAAPSMWAETCEIMSAACEAAHVPTLSAWFWFQGEGDASRGNTNYRADFSRLYAKMDDEPWFGAATAMFIFGISPETGFPKYDSFNEQLRGLANPNLLRFFVDTRDIGPDGWDEVDLLPRIHLNNAGQWDAAELAARAWQRAGSIIESSPDARNKWKLEAERLRVDLENAAQKWYADVIELHRRINKASAEAKAAHEADHARIRKIQNLNVSLSEQLWLAREEAENHRKTIDVLMQSTSWRITGPMRKLKQMVTGT